MGQFSVEKPVPTGSVLSGNQHAVAPNMIERSGELADDVEETEAPTLAIAARAEVNAEAARSEVLMLKAEVKNSTEANAMAKAEIAAAFVWSGIQVGDSETAMVVQPV
jgi:hypothetical protein